jgi:site-specific recombinase XerD
MASISFDKGTGWWSVRFFAGPQQGRIKKTLCKHPGEWSKARPPKRPPAVVTQLAAKYIDQERMAKLGIEVVSRETPLRAHVDAYCERVSHSLRPNTMQAIRNACWKFLEYCDGRKIKSLQAVTHIVCREWIVSRLSSGAARSTVVTERSNLMPIWGQAKKDRIILENPWEEEPVPGKARKEIPTAWTEEEVNRIVAEADGWLRDLLLLGFNTGIRIGALLSLKWTQVDWEAEIIRVPAADSKSGRHYDVPMTPTAHDVLGRRKLTEKHDSGLVFRNPGTDKPYTSRTTYTRIGLLVKRAGIADHGDYNHILRRTYATILLNTGHSMESVQKCLGHSSIAQTEKAYAYLMTKTLKEGVAGFDLSGGVQIKTGDRGEARREDRMEPRVEPETEAQPPCPGTSSEPATVRPGGKNGRQRGDSKTSPR